MPDLRRLILLSVISVLASLSVTASALATTFSRTPPRSRSRSARAAWPYQSEIAVSGLIGPITDVNVTLSRRGHTNPDDIDVLMSRRAATTSC